MYWACGRKARERRRVSKRGTEIERGWANKGKQGANALDGREKLAQCHPFSGSTKADFCSLSRVGS